MCDSDLTLEEFNFFSIFLVWKCPSCLLVLLKSPLFFPAKNLEKQNFYNKSVSNGEMTVITVPPINVDIPLFLGTNSNLK